MLRPLATAPSPPIRPSDWTVFCEESRGSWRVRVLVAVFRVAAEAKKWVGLKTGNGNNRFLICLFHPQKRPYTGFPRYLIGPDQWHGLPVNLTAVLYTAAIKIIKEILEIPPDHGRSFARRSPRVIGCDWWWESEVAAAIDSILAYLAQPQQPRTLENSAPFTNHSAGQRKRLPASKMDPGSSFEFPMPQKRTSLADLPFDCLCQILDDLPQPDLSSLSIASKNLHLSVEPFLYRTVRWSWDPAPLRRVLQLLRSVLRLPERASHIQHVSLISDGYVDPYFRWCCPKYDINWRKEAQSYADIVRRSRDIIQDAHFPDPAKWHRAIGEGNIFALVSILLSQLHNLKTLKLDYSFVWMSGFPGLMLKHALFPVSRGPLQLSTFDFLHEVDYGSNVRRAEVVTCHMMPSMPYGIPDCDLNQFSAWFYLPSLRSLALWLRSFPELEYPGRRTNLHQLRSLVLARATIREDQLPDLLSRTPSLKNLSLGLAYPWRKEVCLSNEAAIRKSLAFIRHTVRNLALCLEYYPSIEGEGGVEEKQKNSPLKLRDLLLQFPDLDSAEMPISIMAGWDPFSTPGLISAIPPHLQHLCLRADFGDHVDSEWFVPTLLYYIQEQLPEVCDKRPNLRQLTVRTLPEEIPTHSSERVQAAEELCARAGIRLKLVCDGLSPGLWACDTSNSGHQGI